LDRAARSVAATLQSAAAPGSRVLLLCPQGLGYLTALFGCLYAGTIAVPAYPPRTNRSLPPLRALAPDAQAAGVPTPSAIVSRAPETFAAAPELGSLRWIAIDSASLPGDPDGDGSPLAPPDLWRPPAVGADTIALLQYTSGSTAAPKGVMVTHANLLYNE